MADSHNCLHKGEAKNSSTGNDPSKFEFLSEMQELIGARHDISYPVTASASGIIIHRPDQVDLGRKECDVDDEEATSASLTLSSKKKEDDTFIWEKETGWGVRGPDGNVEKE